ncbi:hypothetical protein PHO31112_02398 [Pandoraea horticolens]|uniref:Glycosyltransferase RgtA/B/C/D-like domain-containing protein n=1 Tax=Pandoraea horticolens TaxID=2508298 RepID=A0A5E4V2M1_9BURK|nr:hypothetical protein [Pandoraea horticolens]VVE06468.1 hypothetical protein PHO31112_02398 [Pandoraea horticolens]
MSVSANLWQSPRAGQPHRFDAPATPIRLRDILLFGLPLSVSTLIALLAFWPAQVNFDAAYQWMEAVRGTVYTPGLVIPVTLLMRLTSMIWPSPATLILLQTAAMWVTVGYVLAEIQALGVKRLWVIACAVLIAILPQNPLMLTTLGKDSLYALACLMLCAVQLRLVRRGVADLYDIRTAVCFVVAATLPAIIRTNGLASSFAVVIVTAVWLAMARGWRRAAGLVVATVLLIGSVVWGVSRVPQIDDGAGGSVVLVFSNHLIAAAIHDGTPLTPEERQLAERVMPIADWRDSYDCRMMDKNRGAIFAAYQGRPEALKAMLGTQTRALESLALTLILRNPKAALERQLCISRPIWHMGPTPAQNLWDTTAPAGMVGLDAIIVEPYASQLRLSPILPGLSKTLETLTYLTTIPKQASGAQWLWWNTAAPMWLAVLVVLWRWRRHGDRRAAYIYLPFAIHSAVMFVLIPYPAFRYQYPVWAILPFMLLFLAMPVHSARRHRPADVSVG